MNPLQNSNLSAVWQKNFDSKVDRSKLLPQGITAPSKELDSSTTEVFVSSGLTLDKALPAQEQAPAKFVPTKEPSGEMAEMLANLQEAENRYQQHGNDTNGLIRAEHRATATYIAQFEDTSLPNQEYSQNLDGVLANLLAKAEADHKHVENHDGHGHGNHSHKANGHLGAHLGLEAGELKAQALELKAQALELKGQVVNAKAELTTKAAHQLHNSTGDGLDNAINDAVHGALKSHGAGHAEAVDAVHTGNDVHGAATEMAHHGMSTGMQIATGLIGGLSGVLGVFMFKHGWNDFKAGRQHKDNEHALEGANSMIVGTRSVAAGLTAAGHLAHGGVLGAIGSVAQSTLSPLGVVHGAIDAGIGVKDVAVGIKNKDVGQIRKGTLGTGLGTCLILSALGGGIPAIVGAGVFLVGKVANCIYEAKQKTKMLEQAQASLEASANPEVTNQQHH